MAREGMGMEFFFFFLATGHELFLVICRCRWHMCVEPMNFGGREAEALPECKRTPFFV